MNSCIRKEFSPPLTRSRRNNQKRRSTDSPPKNGHITNYFHVVNSVNGFKRECVDSECGEYELDETHFEFDINDVIGTENADKKKIILNNIFKKENCTILYKDEKREICSEDDKSNDSHCIEENGEKDHVEVYANDIIKCEESSGIKEDSFLPNLRLSPRKHASTLQRCVVAKENVKTPHRISLCNDSEASITVSQLKFRQNKYRSRRKLDHNLKSNLQAVNDTTERKEKEVTKKNEIDVKKINIDKNGILKGQRKNNSCTNNANHKLTEYFPIRRSVRKTKKEVMEEKKRDLEIAVLEQREDGLEIASFEGKGRGIVAVRTFYRGEFVVEYAGELVDIPEAKLREERYAQDHTTGCYMYYFRHNNQNYCVDATAESGRLGRLVNHSRNGNLITKTIFIDSRPYLVLIANQDILPGEEVTYDYGDRSKESLQHHPWLAL